MKTDQESNSISTRSKEYASELWQLLRGQIDKHSISTEQNMVEAVPPKKVTGHKNLMKLLILIPYLLAALFVASFFWDFTGMNTEILGKTLNFEGLLRILSISGLIGFMTNWLAITMLFRPSKKRPILGQGLVPAQKDRIAYRLARAVSEDLINPEIIKRKIHESKVISKYREKATEYVKNIIDDPKFRDDLKVLVISYVNEMIADPEVRSRLAKTILEQLDQAVGENSFEKVALKAYSFLKGQEMQQLVEDAIHKLPTGIEKGLDRMDVYLDNLPGKLDEHSEIIEEVVTSLLYRLVNQLDVQALVEDNLRRYDERKLETLIKNASNDQLQYIQYLGAVLGTLGGFIIWEPVASLAVLALFILITISLDQILYKAANGSSSE